MSWPICDSECRFSLARARFCPSRHPSLLYLASLPKSLCDGVSCPEPDVVPAGTWLILVTDRRASLYCARVRSDLSAVDPGSTDLLAEWSSTLHVCLRHPHPCTQTTSFERRVARVAEFVIKTARWDAPHSSICGRQSVHPRTEGAHVGGMGATCCVVATLYYLWV